MARNYQQEAYAEHERGVAIRQWIKERVANIHSNITAADVLGRHGITLHKSGAQEEQFSCPFHGDDAKPSARYYPQNKNGISAVWCFVCREQWDAIRLWQKFNGEVKFSELLFQIEKAFGLPVPEPQSSIHIEDEYNPLKDEVASLFEACENRLREEREYFEMEAHLKLGAILDQLHYVSDNEALPLEAIKKNLEQVLNKIGEKVRNKKCQGD